MGEEYNWAGLINIMAGIVLTGVIGWIGKVHSTVRRNELDIARLQGEVNVEEMKEEIDVIHSRVTEVSNKLSENTGTLQQMNQTMGLIHAHLLNSSK